MTSPVIVEEDAAVDEIERELAIVSQVGSF
jgi:hypothetical protein